MLLLEIKIQRNKENCVIDGITLPKLVYYTTGMANLKKALINFVISTFIVNITFHIIIIIIIINVIHLCDVCQRRQNKPGIKQNKTCNCLDRQVTSRHVTSQSHARRCEILGEKISLSVPPLVCRVKDSHTSSRRKCMTGLSRACNCWVGTHHPSRRTSQLALETDYALINNVG